MANNSEILRLFGSAHNSKGRSTASPAEILAAGLSTPASDSLEENLARASLNAKLNSSGSTKAGGSKGKELKPKFSTPASELDPDSSIKHGPTPTPGNPYPLLIPSKGPKKPTPASDPDLSEHVKTLLNYQHGVYGGEGNITPGHTYTGGIIGHIERMINVKNINALLSGNVDENTSDWALFTTQGTLLGYSTPTPSTLARTVSAKASGAFRAHTAILTNTNEDPDHVKKLRNNAAHFGKLLELLLRPEGSIRALIIVIDNMVVVLHDVKERLFIAAMLSVEECEKGEEIEQEDGVKRTMKRQGLIWRAEAMTGHLLEDLVDFKMPAGFF